MAARDEGFALVELMVALVLGLIATAALGSLFQLVSASHREGAQLARMQDSLRFAMAQLAQDIEMAGFFAQLRDPDAAVTVHESIGSYRSARCEGAWVFGDRSAVAAAGDATPAAAHAAFPCISAAEFVGGSDILALKRLRGRCTDPRADGNGDGVEDGDGRYYLRTDGAASVLYRHADGVGPPAPGGRVCAATAASGGVDSYEYVPVIWYVRRYPVSTVAPLPSLCRKALRGEAMEAECLVEGLEDLQVEFGIDHDADGAVDGYRPLSGQVPPALARRIVAIRVHLLARSAQRDPQYSTAKTFQLGDRTRAMPADGYHRRSLSSVVLIRNVASRLRPAALPG